MVQITRPPALLESASDVVQEGLERARWAIDSVADRASEATEAVDVDSVRSMGRELIESLQARQQVCMAPIKDARGERVKSAAMVGVVILVATLVALLLAREISKRRAAQRRPQRALDRPERPEMDGQEQESPVA